MKIISNDTQNGVTDTTACSIGKAYKLPTMIGAGVMWNHNNRTMIGAGVMWNHNNQWKDGFDYSLQKWGSLGYPSFDGTKYALKNGIYKDRSKFNLGAQYCYGERRRAFVRSSNTDKEGISST